MSDWCNVYQLGTWERRHLCSLCVFVYRVTKWDMMNFTKTSDCQWLFSMFLFPFLDKVWEDSTVLLQSWISSLEEDWITDISVEYFLILKEMSMLDTIPRRGKTYDQTWDFWDPDAVATAAPARLPMDVFCNIIGRQPITEGSRKSRINPTFVAASA